TIIGLRGRGERAASGRARVRARVNVAHRHTPRTHSKNQTGRLSRVGARRCAPRPPIHRRRRFFFLMLRQQPRSTLFPYTTLFRSKEGWLRGQIRSREATLFRADGVVFLLVLKRKTTPASRSADASRNLFDRSTTPPCGDARRGIDRKSTRLNSSHSQISYAVFCLK